MQALHDLLAHSPAVLLFTVIGLGYLVGQLHWGGLRLGVAAVLFVGLFFGAWDARAFVIPEEIYVLGLILFVYTVGLQSGPTFFSLFRKQGLRATRLALVAVLSAAAATWAVARLFGLSGPVATGLFCGGLTNTPALAAAVDALRAQLGGAGLDADALRRSLDGPTVGYSLAYPFGVAGLLLVMQVAAYLSRADFAGERAERSRQADELSLRALRVANPQLAGRTPAALRLLELTGVTFTRLQRGGRVALLTPESVLALDDVLVGVGDERALAAAELLVGPRVEAPEASLQGEIEHRDLLVIKREVAGTPVGKLPLLLGRPVVVSRIRRGGVQITPQPQATLELGDQIRVVAARADLEGVTALVGDPVRDYSEADFLSFSLGLILGVLLGMLPLGLPGGSTLSLGFAGGPLVAGLVLGWLGRSGPIVWTMSQNANLTLRQLGLLFFLAGVGTRAGGSFVHTLRSQGPLLLVAGAVITLTSAAVVLLYARRQGHDMTAALGLLAGVHTQPAALAFANERSGSDLPNASYAAVYPTALIAKIVLAQLLVRL